MQHYHLYNTEDFVWDDFFRKWVLSPTAESDAVWTNWLSEHPGKADTVQQARELVLALQVKQLPLSETELEASVRQIVGQVTDEPVLTSHENRFWRYGWLVAASLVLLAGLSWWLWTTTNRTPINPPTVSAKPGPILLERMNQSNKAMLVSLSDGSVVVLRPNSRIQFPPVFSTNKREVHLSGEAFFEVAHNPTRPFYVFANEVVTKVLGTSFSVRAYQNERDVSVKVRTGRVAVYAQTSQPNRPTESNAVVLKAHQQVAYWRNKARLAKASLIKPTKEDADAVFRRFQFEDTPLPAVLEKLSMAYGVEIMYDKNLLKDCPLTARFSDQSLYEMLQFICTALDGSYTVEEGIITMDLKGCR
ncbi:FecR family protein [Larkinella rosea]|uniref:FecR family protein n=1 Tax=Larkinella rosea TaxID=2025312 RepID=A0A3P1B9R3_9BACT|nr:FecR family protein [Larkinella rosea]RRA97739.1 FecR family protein [Larkinella rosea]